jgi:biopolymer transport protein ExbB
MKKFLTLCAILVLLNPMVSVAEWNADWTAKNKVTVNPQALEGVAGSVVVPVRLHSGNFNFESANIDGSDIRFVAADDKTELKYYIEKFDALNELAVVWVQLQANTATGKEPHIWIYSGNEKAATTSDEKNVLLPTTVGSFHFAQTSLLKDSSSSALQANGAVTSQNAGLIGNAAVFNNSPLTIALNPSLSFSNGITWSAWIKPSVLPQSASLIKIGDAFSLNIDQQNLILTIGEVTLESGVLKPTVWQHVAFSISSGNATVFLDGQQVATSPMIVPEQITEISVGDAFVGEMDELSLSNFSLSPAQIKLAATSQGVDSKLLIVAAGESGEASEEGDVNYIGILINSLTLDAKVVIGILAIMFAISAWVMWSKAILVSKTDKDNKKFLDRFQKASGKELLELGRGFNISNSTLFGLYQAGLREIKKRETDGELSLSGASMDAIKAAVDAELVRETQRINSAMVLLTIAISGGPFLGLLGTVVGVMITFAAIAAAGDVNVNAIAPGIAAALLATVAGLAVAIPALFGYNYLASRIKNITIAMQIFVDEFITRTAELYGKE